MRNAWLSFTPFRLRFFMPHFFLGCDVSKGYADFIILDADRKVVEQPFRLDDTASGHIALESILRTLCLKIPSVQFFAGAESTGGLENNWLAWFSRIATRLPLKAARLNPMGVKNHMKAEQTRTVSDEVSAEAIAGYLIAHPQKVLYDQDDPFYSARRQWTTIELFKKQTTQLYNNLQNLLYSACPSVLLYCRHGVPSWLLHVLIKYPTAAQLCKARPATVAKIPYVTLQRANALVAQAHDDGASTTDPITARTVQLVAKQLISLEQTVDSIVSELRVLWQNNASVKLLCSFTGIATYSALGLLINIRNVALYPTVSHLASYFGLHPIWRDSGDGTFGYHMSKQGRIQPRAILFMATWVAIVRNPHIKKLYVRCQREKKMKPIEAMGVCMHKILRIVYGMLKTNTPYDPAIDQKNQNKMKPVEKKEAHQKHEEKIRRFQQKDSAAPVSKRQAIKRRKGYGSQCANGAECVITTALSHG
jgi:transposase